MLFFRALLMLIAYDVLRTFSTFGRIHKMVKRWTVARRPPDADTIEQCLQSGQLRLHLVPETGSLPAVRLRHYVFAQEEGSSLHIWSWARRNSHSRLMPGSKSTGGQSMRDRMSRRLMRFGIAASQGSQ